MFKYSRTEYSIINMMASIGGYVLNIILSFICRIVFVHQLGSEYLGINGLFSNILSMLSLAELGIGTAMLYALYKPVADNNYKKIAAYMKIYRYAYRIIGCIIGGMGVALIPFLNFLIKNPPNINENIILLYLLFLFSTMSSYFFSYRSSILIANQRNYIVLTISYIVVIIQNIVQIIMLFISKNYLLYLIIQVVFVLISNILISNVAVREYPFIKSNDASKLSRDEILALVKNIKALTVTKLSGILVNNTDNIVITYFRGLITTGVISNYLLLTNTINSLVNQVFTSISASLGNLNAVGKQEHKYIVFKALNLINFWLYGWAAVGIITLSGDIVELFFGEKYVMDMEIPVVLAINFYMLGMQCVVGLYKSTMGLFRYGQYILLITAGINLAGDIILGKKYGVIGILGATVIARLFTNTWYEPFVIYKHGFQKKFHEYILRYIEYAIVLLITCVISFEICELFHSSFEMSFIVKVLVWLLVPNVCFVVAFKKREEFKYILNAAGRLKIRYIKNDLKR